MTPQTRPTSLSPASHVQALARMLHEDWRNAYQAEHGAEPRIKSTSDTRWAAKHGSDHVDIAHAEFADLPRDYQEENLAAAAVALEIVEDAALSGRALDDEFVEWASSEVHRQWVERNPDAPHIQQRSYDRLSEAERDKDRQQIRSAMTLYQEGCPVRFEGPPGAPVRSDRSHSESGTMLLSAIGIGALAAGFVISVLSRR